MKLKRVVGAQTDIEARFEEIRQWITFVRKEKSVVAEGTHCDADLLQIK